MIGSTSFYPDIEECIWSSCEIYSQSKNWL